MQIGFNLPISGPLSDPATVTRLAQQGEARDLGVAAVDIDFERPEADASIAEMRRFGDRVLSRI